MLRGERNEGLSEGSWSQDHIIKMAATPLYGKTPLKIFFSRTREPIAMKLDM